MRLLRLYVLPEPACLLRRVCPGAFAGSDRARRREAARTPTLHHEARSQARIWRHQCLPHMGCALAKGMASSALQVAFKKL